MACVDKLYGLQTPKRRPTAADQGDRDDVQPAGYEPATGHTQTAGALRDARAGRERPTDTGSVRKPAGN